jgi:hypothetical protein
MVQIQQAFPEVGVQNIRKFHPNKIKETPKTQLHKRTQCVNYILGYNVHSKVQNFQGITIVSSM